MTENDVLARLRRLMGALDEAKKSIEMTTRQVDRAQAASDAGRRHASLVDTSHASRASRRSTRSSPTKGADALFRDRIPPDALARLHAISQVQNRSIVAVLNEALRVYERSLRKTLKR